jgi:hypothetical protein
MLIVKGFYKRSMYDYFCDVVLVLFNNGFVSII